MSKIFNGRYTARTDQPFVVFLIGMHINKWWRFDKWFPVSRQWDPCCRPYSQIPKKDSCMRSSSGTSMDPS